MFGKLATASAFIGILSSACGGLSTSSQSSRPFFTSFVSTRAPAGAYTPDQIVGAYDYGPLLNAGIDGTGQTAALIEVDAFDNSDIAAFDQEYKLPAPTINETYIGGQTYALQDNGETTMDLEWLHALAPGATIQIYYLNNELSRRKSWIVLAKALHKAQANGASVVSISLGTCRAGKLAAPTRKAFADLEAAGVSVFVSSGDDGDHPGPVKECGSGIGIAYPGSDPSVVAVGGTSMHIAGNDSIAAETAWNGSGGGRDVTLARAPWQIVAGLPRDGARWSPDVAFVANPNTGVRFLFQGEWHTAGGTSLGAPAWAAAWTLIKQKALAAGTTVGAAAPILYKIGNSKNGSTAFHDITAGRNGTYKAHVGWDAVTGWGTPDVNALANLISSSSTAAR